MPTRTRVLFAFFFFSIFLAACGSAPSPTSIAAPSLAAPPLATPSPFQPDPARPIPATPLPTNAPLPTSTPSPTPTPSFTPTPTATLPLPTPTLDIEYTPPDPDAIATPNFWGNVWEDFPPPRVYPVSTHIPYPVGMLSQPAGQVNILLLGSDQRPHDPSFRTDTILLATLNPSLRTVTLTSIPRDLYVYIPGWTMQRINTAMAYGGFHTMGMTLAYNLGVYPDHYIMVNFSDFVTIVDSLGGIDVNVGQNFSDNRTGYGWYTVKKGIVHMDGETALWYVRSRYTSSDIDRLRRAQEVIQALADRLLEYDVLTRAPELYGLYKESITTDLSLLDIVRLLHSQAPLLQEREIRRYAIGYGIVYDWTDPYTGAMLLLPNRPLLMATMREALNVP